MDQLARGQEVTSNKAAWGPSPFPALQLYLVARARGGELLLVHQEGSPLTQFQFRAVFRRVVAVAGWPKARIGAASSTPTAGLEQEAVRVVGFRCI